MEIKLNTLVNAPLRPTPRAPKAPAELPAQDRADFIKLDQFDRSLREEPVVSPEVLARADYFRSEQYPPEKTIEGLSVLLAVKMSAKPPEQD